MVNRAGNDVVGAHYGLRDWLSQRVTAVVMLLYTVLFLGIVLWNGGMDYAAWKSLWSGAAFRLASFLCLAAMLWHAWVGVRNILMDYVKPLGVRLALQCAVIALLVAYLGWTLQVLWFPAAGAA
jgi:succinate dehydrogenase / fumarate reductase membrane anchor subunit